MSDKVSWYLKLLRMSYEESVALLLDKYGPSKEDYFRELTYTKFLNGINKSPGISKVSRTLEGLYCHHIDENKFENMTNAQFIISQRIPIDYQKRDRLVYCDLIEHAILHAQITRETRGRFGIQGLYIFLLPNIEAWCLQEISPGKMWEMNCMNKARVSRSDAELIINEIVRYIEG